METVLMGFAVWAACALVWLAFVALICRSGQIEDQWATHHAFATDPSADPVPHQPPVPDVPSPAFIVRPRAALDEIVDASVR